jgi:predicted HTH transcriptional regulator
MAPIRSTEYLFSLVHELRNLPAESEWVEFKQNQAVPEEIGEYIFALSNTAALLGKANAYLVWGIDDKSHDIEGTAFVPGTFKVGNEELENWLLRLLHPKIDFRFYSLNMEDRPIVLLEIHAAFRHPVKFKNQAFVRIGSYKKKLKDFPEKERALWRNLDQTPFEAGMLSE